MAFLETAFGALYYRLAGPVGAPALVLVNSLGTDCRIWDDVIADLSGTYRILSYDLRGHGLSSAPEGPYGLDMHLADLSALVERAGLETFALCGVSIGGLIAQGYARHAPQQLKALVLCNTAAKIGTDEFWNARMQAVLESGVAPIADAIMTRWFSPDFAGSQSAAWAAWRGNFLQNNAAGYAATCATLRDSDLTHALSSIDMPVLVFAGTADMATPPELVEATAQQIPGAQFHLFAGVGHLPSLEVPDQLSRHIRAFLEGAGHA